MANEFFKISSFRSSLNGGARPNLFEITMGAPTDVSDPGGVLAAGGEFKFLCRSGAIPAYTLGIIEVPFRGRRIKVPGDRTYADWTVTVFNDESQNMRSVFDNWMAYINDPDGANAIRSNSGDYRTTINVKHLGPSGESTRQYQLIDAFPTDVSAIDLSYDNFDTVQEFTVTFQYHYLTVGAGTVTPIESTAGSETEGVE